MPAIRFLFLRSPIFLIILLLLQGCRNNSRHQESLYSQQLALADSLVHSQPGRADSIYRSLAAKKNLHGSKTMTLALFGLATGFTNKGQVDSARNYLEQAFEDARSHEDTLSMLRYYLEKGNGYLDPGLFDKAETEFLSGLSLAKKNQNQLYQEKFLLSLGSIQSQRGNYPGSIKTYMLGLKQAENQKNKVSEAYALQEIGVVFSQTRDFKEAATYLKRAIALRMELNMSREAADAMQNLGIVYRRAEKPDSAMYYYDNAYRTFALLRDSLKMIMVRYNIAVILKNEKKYDLALKELNDILSVCTRKNILQGAVYAYTTLAAIYQNTGNLPEALACVDSSIALAGRINQLANLPALYDRKREVLASKGDFKAAYQTLEQANVLQDSLFSIDKHAEIFRLKTVYETEKKETDIKLLRIDNKYQATRLRSLIIFIFLGSAVLIMIIWLVWLRLKRTRLLNDLAEERNHLLSEEKKVQQAEIDQLELKTQLQEQELVYKTLVQADLVHFNRSVREKLSPFGMKITRKADKEEFAMALHSLSRDSNRDPLAEFDVLFRQLHPNFYENLSVGCPGLSSSELQICALIRLNFSSKDIARLLSLSVATIETSRSHIRKKFNLDVKDNLSSFLMSK